MLDGGAVRYEIDWTLCNGLPAPAGIPASIDFETRSTVDLKKAGARRYAQHPDTDVLCLATKIGPAESIWVPDMPMPRLLADAIERGEQVAAWNASFEIAIWKEIMVRRYGWPDLPLDRFTCTMQKAALVGCPGALDRAVVALRLNIRKDMDGHRLMLKMCKPLPKRKGDPPGAVRWHDDPADHKRLQGYCIDDVRAECAAANALPEPSPMEAMVMRVDRFINFGGVSVDVEAARGALRIAEQEKKRLNGEMMQITNGRIGSTNQVAMILNFVQERGVSVESLRAADIREILSDVDEIETSGDLDVTDEQIEAMGLMNHGIDPLAIKALRLRAEASKASTAKLNALVNGFTRDFRMTDLFAYGAAYRTQRWAGRRFQAHNLPRANPPCASDDATEAWFDALASGDVEQLRALIPVGVSGAPSMSVMDALKVSLRGFLTASTGHLFAIADLGQIEARGAAWLAGQWDVIEAFERLDAAVARGAPESEIKELDIYAVNGRKMHSDRQAGKIATLACGYGGGWSALLVFALIYGIRFTEEEARAIVDAWRTGNPMIVEAWTREERSARMAIDNPGCVIEIGNGRGSYLYRNGNLMRKLPSGRCLIYRAVRYEPMMTPWGQRRLTLTYEGNIYAKGQPGVFVRLKTYGGKLFQNAVQAICRDILAVGLVRARLAGLVTALHVHDEQAVDSLRARAGDDAEKLVRAMTAPIRWAEGLPIVSSADVSFRYRKG